MKNSKTLLIVDKEDLELIFKKVDKTYEMVKAEAAEAKFNIGEDSLRRLVAEGFLTHYKMERIRGTWYSVDEIRNLFKKI